MVFHFRDPAAIARALLVSFALAALSAGCATVDPAPFTQFADSLQPLRDATDAQAGTAADASRQELIAKVADGTVDPSDLQLEFTSTYKTTYGFAEDDPTFVKLVNFRNGLAALNDALIAYAQSLTILAGGGEGGDILPTKEQFGQMATDLNTNAGAAAKALNKGGDPDNQALLSTAAIQLFKAYIEQRRREDLQEAIEKVQPRVDEFSDAAKLAVRFLASLVETDYSKKIEPLATADPPNATPILALNDTTQAKLAALQSLSNNYGALPAAHRDLLAAASKKKSGLAGLSALIDEATQLRGFVNQLAAANAASQ